MEVPDPAGQLGVFRPDDRRELLDELCCITTSPAAVENASSPSRIAAATSAIATVASSGRPGRPPAASEVVIFTTGTFFMGDPSPFQGVFGGLPNPASTARPGEGSPPHFNRVRDNLFLSA